MQRLFIKKLITAVLFIILIFSFSIANLTTSYKSLLDTYNTEVKSKASISDAIAAVQSSMNDNTLGRYKFIEGYGYIQRLMLKNEESNYEVIKDEDGTMHYSFFGDKPNPVYTLVKRTVALKNGLKNSKTKFAYVMPPDKYVKGHSKLSYGLPYNYANETASVFLNLLNENNIDTIDLRNFLADSGISYKNMFFKTDHHWKPQTAFYEFGQLAKTLKTKYKLNMQDLDFYTNKKNWNFVTYKDSYIGSMGRKTGRLYDGADDFTLIYPKFSTNYTYNSVTGSQKTKISGRFEDALITVSPFRNKKGTYALEGDKYSSYLFGNQGIVHVQNKNMPNGPKLLFIKDSYTVSLAAFLSSVCSDIYLVDPRYFTGDIAKYVNSVDVDCVFVSFYPQDLTEDFFKFYQNKKEAK